MRRALIYGDRMPWGWEYASEVGDLRVRRRRCRHEAGLVLDQHRTEAVPPYVFLTELARCVECGAPLVRVKRYGPGSDGDTGWRLAP